jgi:hypothetical protein
VGSWAILLLRLKNQNKHSFTDYFRAFSINYCLFTARVERIRRSISAKPTILSSVVQLQSKALIHSAEMETDLARFCDLMDVNTWPIRSA